MICEYDWKIEWYSVLSKACLDCPLNITSCERLDCVTANGVPRSIITVNRQLPGPGINYLNYLNIIKMTAKTFSTRLLDKNISSCLKHDNKLSSLQLDKLK